MYDATHCSHKEGREENLFSYKAFEFCLFKDARIRYTVAEIILL